MTSILLKVIEKIVCNQVTSYLDQNGTLHESQDGFRKGRSCSDLLVKSIDDWLLARDSKMYTAIVFIDLSKSFDNVNHQSCILLLQQCGIEGVR